MSPTPSTTNTPAATARRVFAFNLGLLAGGETGARLRRILDLAGHTVQTGLPRATDAVLVWGQSPYAGRGARMARATGAALWRVEDAFLRSVLPGRAGGPFSMPAGLLLDRQGGVHFDPARASDLEDILNHHAFDADLRGRARRAMAALRHAGLSKYNAFDPAVPAPSCGYVLVVDQTANDASLRASRADAGTFRRMLADARRDHPDSPVLIRSHPETAQGLRGGHFGPADLDTRTRFAPDDAGPWALLQGAKAVYTVSSQIGFEAMQAGHRPVLYGQPFYAGWGLSEDRAGAPLRRGRKLAVEEIWAGAMILAPLWYDPHRDRLCDVETVLHNLEAEARAWREDRHGWIAANMRLWKRKHMQAAFGRVKPLRFAPALPPARPADGRRVMVWGAGGDEGVVRVEDGLIRSRGLGAALVPPLSLVLDDLGIYYDPTRPSRLEVLIAASVDLPDAARARAADLVTRITALGISKYNLGGAPPESFPADWQGRQKVLVVGQVEDDASIRLGAGEIRSNAALLQAAREAHPDAVILYKPHPDVEAGLRPGRVDHALRWADRVLDRGDPARIMARVDRLWTMTSGMGFEALLRGLPVTCTGQPFYAGWGLTEDRGPALPRRTARPDIIALAHAALIEYPRYFDPVSGRPCPPEAAIAHLAGGQGPRIGPAHRLLAKAQGAMAGYAHWWR